MSDGDVVTFVVARIGAERFAFDLDTVFEAADAAGLDPAPQLPPGALGLLNWRGVAYTVWSPEPVLRVRPRAPGTVLFLRTGADVAALAVDEAEDLITLPRMNVRAMPGIEDSAGLIRGGVHAGEMFATVVDAAKLAAELTGRGGAVQRSV